MKYKKCSRLSCLYHASPNQPNGCDYCLLTGQLRGCPAGTAKRKQATRNTLLNIQGSPGNGAISIQEE